MIPDQESVQLDKILKEIWHVYWEEEKQAGQKIPYDSKQIPEGCTIQSDPQLIRHLVYHVFQFVYIIGGQIYLIEIHKEGKDKIKLNIFFLDGTLPDTMPQQLTSLIENIDSIEARLSLAIVIKINKLLQGDFSIRIINKQRKVLSHILLKGI